MTKGLISDHQVHCAKAKGDQEEKVAFVLELTDQRLVIGETHVLLFCGLEICKLLPVC